MSDNSNDFGAFLTGFVIGGLAGAAISLLMAPQSGEETREQIVGKGIELRDRADDELRQFRVRAEESLEDLRVQAEEIQKRAVEQMEEARARVGTAVEQGTEAVKKARMELTKDNSKGVKTEEASEGSAS
jgi:gas vesicle protein